MEHLGFVKQKFSIVAENQENKGIEKYGQPLEPMDGYDWLEMAEQEQVDGYKYLVAEQVKRQRVIGRIREKTNDIEINHWLDLLEGK